MLICQNISCKVLGAEMWKNYGQKRCWFVSYEKRKDAYLLETWSEKVLIRLKNGADLFKNIK